MGLAVDQHGDTGGAGSGLEGLGLAVRADEQVDEGEGVGDGHGVGGDVVGAREMGVSVGNEARDVKAVPILELWHRNTAARGRRWGLRAAGDEGGGVIVAVAAAMAITRPK